MKHELARLQGMYILSKVQLRTVVGIHVFERIVRRVGSIDSKN